MVRVLAEGGETGGRIALVETTERRGAGPPLHRHTHQDEWVYVLEGRVTFHIEGERFAGSAGTCAVLPRGREHGYGIDSDEARLLMVLAPAESGFETCIGEMIRCHDGAATGQEIERLVATAARHGVEITGPRNDNANGATPP